MCAGGNPSAGRPLRPKLGEALEPVFQFCLETACGRLVEALTLHAVRKIMLSGKGLFLIVIVGVAAAIALLLHQPRRRVENMFRGRKRATLLRRLLGCAEGAVRGVRF